MSIGPAVVEAYYSVEGQLTPNQGFPNPLNLSLLLSWDHSPGKNILPYPRLGPLLRHGVAPPRPLSHGSQRRGLGAGMDPACVRCAAEDVSNQG